MNWCDIDSGTANERHTQEAKIERAFLQHPTLVGCKDIAQRKFHERIHLAVFSGQPSQQLASGRGDKSEPDNAYFSLRSQPRALSVFAADVPEKQTKLMAATQRPVTDVALKEASGAPAWKSTSSWFVYGSADKVIPPAVHAFMAERADAKNTIVVKGASHVVMISHPSVVANLIEKAAAATAK
jgi:pimeloyl-ACP methyl ester carboxylesterase